MRHVSLPILIEAFIVDEHGYLISFSHLPSCSLVLTWVHQFLLRRPSSHLITLTTTFMYSVTKKQMKLALYTRGMLAELVSSSLSSKGKVGFGHEVP